MRFGAPAFLWLLLLAPLLGAFLWWGLRKRQALMASFVTPRLLGTLTIGVSQKRERWRMVLFVVGFSLLILALARPQWGFVWEEVKTRGLDIVVAIDTSKSMLVEDIAPNRLARAKLAAMDLAQQARSDRLGLVAFSGSGFLQCPLTVDEAAFRQSVESLTVTTIPVVGSAIAEAIAAAQTAFKEGENHRVLVLISDGEDNAEGAVEAARQAAESALKIYTIGVGTTEGERIPVRKESGAVDYVQDEDGNVRLSRLNEELLRDVAGATDGGIYLPLRGARTMETLYQQVLAKLPKSENQEKLVKQYRERYHWPLGLGILLLIIEIFWMPVAKVGKPNPTAAVRAVAILLALLAAVQSVEGSTATALREYRSGNFEQSLKEYEALLKRNPKDPKLRFNAGAAAYQNGQYDAALKHFSEALTAQDLDLQRSAYYNRGNTQFQLGENQQDPKQRSEAWKKAIRDYESALKLNNRDTDATHNRDLVKRLLQELQQQQQQQSQNQDDNKDDNEQQQQQQQQQQGGENQQQQQQQSRGEQQQEQQSQQEQQNQQQQPAQSSDDQQQPQSATQQQPQQQQQEQGQGQEPQQRDGDDGQKGDGSKDQPGKPNPGEQSEQNKDDQSRAGTPEGQMTPEQARRLLDAQKEGEKILPAGGQRQSGDARKRLPDW